MKLKRMISLTALLALVLTLALPFGAQAASFTDVKDVQTAEDAEILRMLGVIDGMGGGELKPDEDLTRAQFCKMAVVMMGNKGLVNQYKTYTIFPDVRGSHWAAGYINLAVRGENKIIHGFPDGSFHPDEPITFGQTVTILMRMLGYGDGDVGDIWPYGYINTAASIGLTEGVELDANDSVKRAQAIKLFAELLSTDRKSGGSYAAGLGNLVKNVILMDTNATADDGTEGCIKVQDGTIYKVAQFAADPSMTGRKGSLLLAENGKVLTFIPDGNGSRVSATVSEAKANGIVDISGKKYTVQSAATVYYRGEPTTWGEVFFELRPGTAVTLYYNGAGRVEYLFAGIAPTEDAVLVEADGSTRGFERLTESTGYAIMKNGLPAKVDDLRQYDVAVYDERTNTVRVCDVRLTGMYTDAQPNVESPSKVTVTGCEFEVLPGAVESMANFRIGQQVTVLLTEDNKVAGAVAPEILRGNAVGIATEVSKDLAKVELFNGLIVEGDPSWQTIWEDKNLDGIEGEGEREELDFSGDYIGQLVRVSTYGKDDLALNLASYGTDYGELDVSARKVGDAPLADSVRIYEKVERGPLDGISLSAIPVARVPSSKVLYAEKDYAGRVSILVIGNVTGDSYVYGKYQVTTTQVGSSELGGTNGLVSVVNGSGTSEQAASHSGYTDGAYGGIAFCKNTEGESRVAAEAKLTKLADVSNSQWNGNGTVTVSGKTYTVADDVACYNETTGKWVTLAQARAFSDVADLYFDGVGEKIRIVAVRQPK